MIRQYGGKMKETYGVPVEEIQEAIKHGVRKINIDTDIRLAMTGAMRKFLAENPEKFDAARLAEAGARGGLAHLQAALSAVRLRRPGEQDQGPAADHDGAEVPARRAGANSGLTLLTHGLEPAAARAGGLFVERPPLRRAAKGLWAQ